MCTRCAYQFIAALYMLQCHTYHDHVAEIGGPADNINDQLGVVDKCVVVLV